MLTFEYGLRWPKSRARSLGKPSNAKGTVQSALKDIQKHLKALKLHTNRCVIRGDFKLKKDGTPYATQTGVLDKGVSLEIWHNNELHLITCDVWSQQHHNLLAIGKYLGGWWVQHTWCGYPVPALLATVKMQAVAEPKPQHEQPMNSWWTVLGFVGRPNPGAAAWTTAQALYRSRAQVCHPDKETGSTEAFQALQEAYTKAKKYFAK